MNRTILHGDVLDKFKEIPDESINCIISSPPYWGLRDYGVEGQIGLEPDFHDYLTTMSKIMIECKRVLRKDGTCWINLGDTYNGTGDHTSMDDEDFVSQNLQKGNDYMKNKPKDDSTVQRKSRFGIPERFYINCIDDGWIARNHIPWYKSNSMPSSVKDRFTNKWESIFFFAKSQKYYFNLDAVREKTITETKPFNIRVRENKTGHAQAKLGDRSWKASEDELNTHNEKGERKQDSTLGADGKPKANYKGFNERWAKTQIKEHSKKLEENGAPNSNARLQARVQAARDNGFNHDHCLDNPKGKNPGDVFFINPRPFPQAHFATFPVDLPLRILKCGCPNDGIVLDPFFGAGTVGVAAERLGMRWVGIELNEEYIRIARKRLDPLMMERFW
jgi:DNA modification methylase